MNNPDGPIIYPVQQPRLTDELFLEFTILPWQAEIMNRLRIPDMSITTAYQSRHDASPRTKALAAKVARGKGPPPSASWRGNERNTKYRSQ